MPRPRILLADDHTLLLEAFKKLLESTYDVVGTATDGHALVKAAEELKPDVILVDVAMPHLNGLDACERVRQRVPRAKLVFLTMNDDPDTAAEAIRRGASGYLLKVSAPSELFEAIRHVLGGRTYVTPAIAKGPVGVFVARAEKGKGSGLTLRQREVLQLLAEGKSMKEAAEHSQRHAPHDRVPQVFDDGTTGLQDDCSAHSACGRARPRERGTHRDIDCVFVRIVHSTPVFPTCQFRQ